MPWALPAAANAFIRSSLWLMTCSSCTPPPAPLTPPSSPTGMTTSTCPTRLATPGFGAVARFRATDGMKPEWLATYEIKPGTLDTPAYKALWENASEREKRIMASVGTLDRRVYSPLSDSWADGVSAAPARRRWSWRCRCRCRRRSSPTWRRTTTRSTTRCCSAVPGWRRARRFVLTAGDRAEVPVAARDRLRGGVRPAGLQGRDLDALAEPDRRDRDRPREAGLRAAQVVRLSSVLAGVWGPTEA